MILRILSSKAAVAHEAAKQAAATISDSISTRGEARLIAATGASQFDFLDALTKIAGIDWKRVEMFHLDEYDGLSEQASASFCRYLRKRLIDKVGLAKYHLLDGTQPPATVIEKVTAEIRKAPIDVAFVGVGENGHLAFNDPPADFDTEEAYMIVNLDENCRKQQLGEGWFPSLADVPLLALSMTVKQIMRSKQILAIAPDTRKAKAIKACFDGGVSPMRQRRFCSAIRIRHSILTMSRRRFCHRLPSRPMPVKRCRVDGCASPDIVTRFSVNKTMRRGGFICSYGPRYCSQPGTAK